MTAWPATATPTLLRGAYGVALCAAPGAVLGLAGGPPASRRARAVARILGVRQLVQAAVSEVALAPGTGSEDRAVLLALGAAVDTLHAASMLGLALFDAPRRRAGLADGLIALAFAADALARCS
ncbi:MAG TPA: hypothetical protein VHU92_10800 [Streptosporangiaceae bacterium]|nr:hypothetical protein [Streptosporangiaceae bacterium]